MIVLLTHLDQMNQDAKDDKEEADYKGQVLLHNPEMFANLYGGEEEVDDDTDVDYVMPDSPEEAMEVLNALQRSGNFD